MGRLTTHVLDTANGCPGEGIQLTLKRIEGAEETVIRDAVTNADGRVDSPLLERQDFQVGSYLLEFRVGDYFRGLGTGLTDPAFLDIVPIRFGIADPEAHYHVPLLVSPYGYSTYRGS